jgi:NADPH:quinone reductase-like Zn-dependent oxidoreductase
VGIAGVQLAAATGAHVVATVRREGLRPAVAAIGQGVGGGDVSVVAPAEFQERGPFDVILDVVGASNMPGNLAALAYRGRIAVIGALGGTTFEFDMTELVQRHARIHGSLLGDRPFADLAAATQAVERSVLPLLAAGRIRVPVHAEFPMAEAEAAYEAFAAGGTLGKIVLVN